MNLVDIVKHRSDPGIIIVAPQGDYVYVNDRARDLAASFRSPEFGEILQHMADKLRQENPGTNGSEGPGSVPVLITNDSGVYALRHFKVPKVNGEADPSGLLVLIEQISTRTAVDLEQALLQYDLTRRERDIVRLLFKGMCNKVIAQQLSIGPYTVKDHLKKIMLKLNVNSRIAIVSKLLKLS